jgi:hypothetical protein
MKRFLIVSLILLGSGLIWSRCQNLVALASEQIEDRKATLALQQHTVDGLMDQVRAAEKTGRQSQAALETVRQAADHLTPDVLSLLEQFRTGSLKELPENWRTILGGSWDASSTYVLIPKVSVKPAL